MWNQNTGTHNTEARELGAHPEDLISDPSPTSGGSQYSCWNPLEPPVPDLMSSSGLHGYLCICAIYSDTHTSKKTKLKNPVASKVKAEKKYAPIRLSK